MSLQAHWKPMYDSSWKQLAGSFKKSIIKHLFSKDNKSGKSAHFDTVDVADEAIETEFANLPDQYRAAFEASGKTMADYIKMLTPHLEIFQSQVVLFPKQIEVGHTFRSLDEMAENANPQGKKINQIMRQYYKKEEKVMFDALFAASKQISSDGENITTQNFPAGQVVTTTAASFSVETIREVMEKYESNYAEGEKVYIVISPAAKTNLIKNSKGEITSKDFVDSGRYFATGELPDVYGACLIVHPMVSDYKSTNADAFVAFTEDAVVYNQFAAERKELEKNPDKKFLPQFYVEEFVGCVRLDDKLVVQGALTA